MSCLNCQSTLTGPFCSACGQKQRCQRLTLRKIGKDFFAQVFNTEQGLLHTLSLSLRRPATLTSNYMRGITRPYARPAGLLIVLLTLLQLLSIWLGFTENFAHGMVDASRTGDAQTVDVQATVAQVEQYYVAAFLLWLPWAVLCSRALFRSRGWNLAEHFVAHCYFLAGFACLLGGSLLIGYYLPQGYYWLETAVLAAPLLYYWYAIGSAFKVRWYQQFWAVPLFFVVSGVFGMVTVAFIANLASLKV